MSLITVDKTTSTIGILVTVIVLVYFYHSLSQPPTTISPFYIKVIEENEEHIENNNLTYSLYSSQKNKSNLSFAYILNNKNLCDNASIQVIFIVTSYFGNVETRSAMRRAFNQEQLANLNFRRVFLLGEAPNDKYTTQESVIHENRRFGDIIQGSFIEAYRNLTYKHVMGLKWVLEFCPNSQYIVKMDDDIVAYVSKIKRVLESLTIKQEVFFAGYLMRKMVPIREPANKWYVTFQEYKSSTYPSFVSGWFYITTPETAKRLVLLYKHVEYFWIDDVYVTGILAKILKIKHYDISKYFTVFPEFLECCISDVQKNLDCDILVGPNGGDNNLFYKFNKAMAFCETAECNSKRLRPLNDTCVAKKKVNLGRGEPKISNYKLH